jgi:hypothetical protein
MHQPSAREPPHVLLSVLNPNKPLLATTPAAAATAPSRAAPRRAMLAARSGRALGRPCPPSRLLALACPTPPARAARQPSHFCLGCPPQVSACSRPSAQSLAAFIKGCAGGSGALSLCARRGPLPRPPTPHSLRSFRLGFPVRCNPTPRDPRPAQRRARRGAPPHACVRFGGGQPSCRLALPLTPRPGRRTRGHKTILTIRPRAPAHLCAGPPTRHGSLLCPGPTNFTGAAPLKRPRFHPIAKSVTLHCTNNPPGLLSESSRCFTRRRRCCCCCRLCRRVGAGARKRRRM